MDIARISKVHEQITRDILWAHEQELRSLREEIELLKRPTAAIGFRVKEGEKSMTTAFKNARHHVPD